MEIYIQKFILEKGLKRKAFLSFKSTLNKIFDTAVYQGWISFNPAKHVRNKRLMEMCDQSLAARETEDVLLSDEELQAVFAEVKRRRDLPRNKGYYYFEGMIRLHALLGCRPAELCSLKWVDVKGMDGKEAKASPALHIHAQIKENGSDSRYEYVPVTKNEKGISRGGRYFPITAPIKAILDEMKQM